MSQDYEVTPSSEYWFLKIIREAGWGSRQLRIASSLKIKYLFSVSYPDWPINIVAVEDKKTRSSIDLFNSNLLVGFRSLLLSMVHAWFNLSTTKWRFSQILDYLAQRPDV